MTIFKSSHPPNPHSSHTGLLHVRGWLLFYLHIKRNRLSRVYSFIPLLATLPLTIRIYKLHYIRRLFRTQYIIDLFQPPSLFLLCCIYCARPFLPAATLCVKLSSPLLGPIYPHFLHRKCRNHRLRSLHTPP